MNKATSLSILLLAAGIVTSVSILSGYQVLFTIALAYYTYQAYRDQRLHLPKSSLWLLVFFFVALLSTSLNYELIPKPSKNFGRLKYYLYGIGGIYVLRYWLAETSDKVKKIIFSLFLVSVIIAGLYAMGIYFFTSQKRARPLTETMRYGYGSAMFLLTLLSTYLHREKLKQYFNPKLLLAAIIIGFLGMFFTYTRGALLGFLCGLPFVLYYYRPKLAIWAGGASILIVTILTSIYILAPSSNAKFRLLSAKNVGSDEIRMSQWRSAVIAIQERPILGWGLSNFHTQLQRIKETYDLPAKNYKDAHSHNLFLETGSGTGLIGLFFFLGWLITWAAECFKANGLVRALVIPFGVAFVISSQFEVTFDANNASMIFFIYAMSAAIYSKKSRES